MRVGMIAIAMLAGAAAFNGSAFGDTALDPAPEIVPIVAPGEQIGIACDALLIAQQSSDVRVVLTVSAVPGDNGGYGKVLATEQKVTRGAVQVTVPNMPEIVDHTYDLAVYVSDSKKSLTCDAGHFKVSGHLS